MTFSIKRIIRALAAPRHLLWCRRALWAEILAELHRRGEDRHEAGAFLLGIRHGRRKEVREALYYDELDPDAYASGVCILKADAFAALWAHCRTRQLTVVGDVHTHPGGAWQSGTDKANPMVARTGHLAVIVPDYARPPVQERRLGVYLYLGGHRWIDLSGRKWRRALYFGIWN